MDIVGAMRSARVIGLLLWVLCALWAVWALAACGGNETPEARTTSAGTTSTAEPPNTERPAQDPEPDPAGGGDRKGDTGEDPEDESGPSAAELREQRAEESIEAAYTDYIDAINARDGGRLCRLLPNGAEQTLKTPIERGGCANRISRSIGYEDPRGYPVWKRTVLSGFESLRLSRDLRSAGITGAIVTQFADRTEPSVESDIAYLELSGGEWRLAKPSGALYRAIGRPDFPPQAISPPDDRFPGA